MKFIFIISIGILIHFSAYAQEGDKCQIKFEYAVSKIENTNLFDVNLILINGQGQFEVKLFDMANNKMLEYGSFKSQNGINQMVFKNLNKGVYLIGISQGDCRQTLGGINGFKIE